MIENQGGVEVKEIKLVTGSVWSSIAIVATALIIAVAGVFSVLEYNKTQWDIAKLQKDAQIQASQNIKGGLGELGDGICLTSSKSALYC